MPNTGGTGGTVSSCTKSDASGRSVTVYFPGPPPKTETYDVDAEEYATFLAAYSKCGNVAVTAPDAAGTGVTGVTAKP